MNEKELISRKIKMILTSADIICIMVDEIADLLMEDCECMTKQDIKKMITQDIIEILNTRERDG